MGKCGPAVTPAMTMRPGATSRLGLEPDAFLDGGPGIAQSITRHGNTGLPIVAPRNPPRVSLRTHLGGWY